MKFTMINCFVVGLFVSNAHARSVLGICYGAPNCQGMQANKPISQSSCRSLLAKEKYDIGSWAGNSKACTNINLAEDPCYQPFGAIVQNFGPPQPPTSIPSWCFSRPKPDRDGRTTSERKGYQPFGAIIQDFPTDPK
jgi:hypothetical protein